MTVTASRSGTARRLAAALAATALAGLGLLAGPAQPAVATEPAESCVGVVVDARLLGGGVTTGCAKGDPDSGLEALTMAGYTYAFVPRQPGLVCQVDGAPECSRTATDTYWSYWYRAKGSSTWVYASQGAAGHDPAPGSTEAWVWQDGGRRQPPDIALRTICPQVASAPSATRTPAPTKTATKAATRSASPVPDRTGSASAASSPRRSSSTKPRAAASGRTSERPSSSATTSAAPTSATAGATTATPSSSPVAKVAEPDSADGALPWVGVAVAAGLVAVLGGSALARSRRGGGP